MKIDAIFQVRMGSTRLPGKMFKKIMGKPLLWHVIQRVKASRLVNRIILAMTEEKKDDRIVKFAKKMRLLYYRGSTDNVLDRVYQAAKKFGSDIIVRITPDDPFKDPQIIDEFISYFLKNKFDYVSNTVRPTYPEGLDIEVFSFLALKKAWPEAKKSSEKEHLTPYIWKNPKKFKIKNLTLKKNLSSLRWTIDYQKDLEFAREVYKKLYPKKKIFLMQDILNLLNEKFDFPKINQGIVYHEGYLKSLKQDKLINKKKPI
ncbi:MAG: acylneuraminate cytidylyltransferase [Candidatus Nealsonbacteria bacterium RBG_13_38_11]|uniref:Acylneuraminate cytidylyltransferase n=1 Tax=Candidatus Nealsonbacteria bacterium RBG_13_38_11 TaxID=1801662 RepID=A0A1G2DXN0_9BACT|nr:MAG: acylneuraminate cytidylyltransferase [Candidatus Nealsonbacteria bacterium RBG_13_38_11]